MTTVNQQEKETDAGENILWRGKPRRFVRFWWWDLWGIPFSLLWGGFSIVFFVGVLISGPYIFAIWAFPFMLFGVNMMIGRFVRRWYTLKNVEYFLTDTKIIFRGKKRDQSIFLSSFGQVHLSKERGKLGTIYLGDYPINQTNYLIEFFNFDKVFPKSKEILALEFIEDPERVRDLIISKQKDYMDSILKKT